MNHVVTFRRKWYFEVRRDFEEMWYLLFWPTVPYIYTSCDIWSFLILPLGSAFKNVGRKFTRSIVVVDSVRENVPRGAHRQRLHEKGLVVSFVDLWTHWSEEEVYQAIETALQGVIDVSKPYPRYKMYQLLPHSALIDVHVVTHFCG